jgi:hypothetical protein
VIAVAAGELDSVEEIAAVLRPCNPPGALTPPVAAVMFLGNGTGWSLDLTSDVIIGKPSSNLIHRR